MTTYDLTLSIGCNVNDEPKWNYETVIRAATAIFGTDFTAWKCAGSFGGIREESIRFQVFGIEDEEGTLRKIKTLRMILNQESIAATFTESQTVFIDDQTETLFAQQA